MENILERMKNAYQKSKEKKIIIDDVQTKCIKGENYKTVSFWKDDARYSTLVNYDANIPAIGESMTYSKLQEMKVSMKEQEPEKPRRRGKCR